MSKEIEGVYLKYIVKRIMEPDCGCEERLDDYVPLDKVILRDENGQEIEMDISDKELYQKDINEGDWVYFDLNNVIFKE